MLRRALWDQLPPSDGPAALVQACLSLAAQSLLTTEPTVQECIAARAWVVTAQLARA